MPRRRAGLVVGAGPAVEAGNRVRDTLGEEVRGHGCVRKKPRSVNQRDCIIPDGELVRTEVIQKIAADLREAPEAVE